MQWRRLDRVRRHLARSLAAVDHHHHGLTTARLLAQLCDELLAAIDEFRGQVSRLKPLQHPDQTAWPF